MTLAQARARLRALGYVIAKRDNEYRTVRKGVRKHKRTTRTRSKMQ